MTTKRLAFLFAVLALAALPLWAVNVDKTVAASADDAHESAGTTVVNGTNFTLDGSGEFFGFRFTDIAITPGSTCNSASLRLNFSSGALDEPDVVIHGEDTATPAQFTAAGNPNNNISGRTRTTASVDWFSANLGAPGQFNSPDLCNVIAELIASYTYDGDDAMVFIVLSKNNDEAQDMNVSLWDAASDPEPELHIVYTEPAAGGRRRTVVVGNN